MKIGPWKLEGRVLLAPMAGITDLPFRRLCRRWGAALAASEMVASDPTLRNTPKSQWRSTLEEDGGPRVVQIAGADPAALAEAARYNVGRGADIIDINLGCPAKKVCNRMAGSALMADESLVREILEAVVAAVTVPVTLKCRTGPTAERRNVLSIARMAEDAGIASLAVHGRTRDQAYRGEAEYRSLEAVCRAVNIPVVANGDINTPEWAATVLRETGADAVMVGRGAQGQPWLFKSIHHYLETGTHPALPTVAVRRQTLREHLQSVHAFYGEWMGTRICRKHIKWYLQRNWQVSAGDTRRLMRAHDPVEQLALLDEVLAEAPALPEAA